MIFTYILFFLFTVFCVLSSFSMIFAKNPIFSILFLIFTFTNISCILFLFDFEFLPITFLIIYVGAIAVLFLFVLMMLNIKTVELQDNHTYYLPISFVFGFIFLIEFVSIIKFDQDTVVFFNKDSIVYLFDLLLSANLTNFYFFDLFFVKSNIKEISLALFNDNIFSFIVSGFILLLAMVSTIVLTGFKQFTNKSQNVYSQLLKNHKNALVFFN